MIYKNNRKGIKKGDRCKKTAGKKGFDCRNGEWYCRNHAINVWQKENAKKQSKQTSRRSARKRRIWKASNIVTVCQQKKNNSVKNIGRNKRSSGVDFGPDVEQSETSEVVAKEYMRYLGAHLFSNKMASLNLTEHLFDVLNQEGMLQKGVSRATLTRTVVELGLISRHLIAEVLPHMKDICLGIDESSKSNGRSFIEVVIDGVIEKRNEKDKGHWLFKEGLHSFTIGFHEVSGKTAQDLMDAITDSFSDINELQKEMRIEENKKLSVLDIVSLAADWTSSNTGKKKGLLSLLNKKRKEYDQNAEEVTFVGCMDHAVSTIQKNFCKVTLPEILSAFSIKKNPLPSLQSLMSHISGLGKQEFDGFLLANYNKYKIKCLPLHRVSETRYCSSALAARVVSDHVPLFTQFLSEKKIKDVSQKCLLTDHGLEIIHLLSNTALKLHLPFMKAAAESHTIDSYESLLTLYMNDIYHSFQSFEDFLRHWDFNLKDWEEKEMREIFQEAHELVGKVRDYLFDKNPSTKTRNQFHKTDYSSLAKKFPNITPAQLHVILCFEFNLDALYVLKQKYTLFKESIGENEREKFVKASNRNVEGGFSVYNRLFAKNPNLNTVVASSVMAIRGATGGDWEMVKKIISHYSKEEIQKETWFSKVYSKARDELDSKGRLAITQSKWLRVSTGRQKELASGATPWLKNPLETLI